MLSAVWKGGVEMKKGVRIGFICLTTALIILIVGIGLCEKIQANRNNELVENIRIEYNSFSELIVKQTNGDSVPFKEFDMTRRNLQRFIGRYGEEAAAANDVEVLNNNISELWKKIMTAYYLKDTTETEITADEILRQKDLIDGQVENILDEG